MSRWSYFAKRLVLAVPVTLFGMSITFFLIYAGPVDPALAILGQGATAERIEAIHRQLGMNQPLWEQYFDFLVNMITFDLGQSWVVSPDTGAWQLILAYAPRTVWMGALAIILPLFIGIPLGFFAGLRPNTFSDYSASFGGIVWRAMPNFWLAVLALLFLSRTEVFLLGFDWENWLVTTPIVGAPPMENFFTVEGFIAATKMVLPDSLILGSASMGNEMRIGRTAILEAKNSNYVETARAKGLSERKIVWKHMFRNALIPLVPVITAEAGLLIGGALLVETVFGINGIGVLFFRAVTSGDLPLTAALMYMFILFMVAMNIFQDFLYTIIDPRVGFEGQ